MFGWFLSNPTIIAIFAAVVGAIGLAFQQRLAGAKAERNKHLKADNAALKDRVEMDREATDIERKTAGMSDDEARKEALKWARR